jgi:hypothetical protein
MAERYKVIHCPVDELEYELNQLGEAWLPVVWNFSQDIPPSQAIVVCVPPPRQTAMMIPAQIPGMRRQ